MKRGGIKGTLSILIRKFRTAKVATASTASGTLSTVYSRTGVGYIKDISVSNSSSTAPVILKVTIDGVVIINDVSVGVHVPLPLQAEYFTSVLIEHRVLGGTGYTNVVHEEF